MLDRSTRLNGLDLQGRTDVGQHGWAKRQRLGMMLLPSLVFRPKIEGTRVLQVRRKNNGLVAGFARQLNAQVPSIKSDKDEVEVLGRQVLGSECIESVDSVSKGTRASNMLPSQSSQACCGGNALAKEVRKGETSEKLEREKTKRKRRRERI